MCSDNTSQYLGFVSISLVFLPPAFFLHCKPGTPKLGDCAALYYACLFLKGCRKHERLFLYRMQHEEHAYLVMGVGIHSAALKLV